VLTSTIYPAYWYWGGWHV